jgi:hypothetical protein
VGSLADPLKPSVAGGARERGSVRTLARADLPDLVATARTCLIDGDEPARVFVVAVRPVDETWDHILRIQRAVLISVGVIRFP